MALSRSLKNLMQNAPMYGRQSPTQRPVMQSGRRMPQGPQPGFGGQRPRMSKPVTVRDKAMRPRTSKPVTVDRGSTFGFMDRGKQQPGFGTPKLGGAQQQPDHRRQFGAMPRTGRPMGRYMR